MSGLGLEDLAQPDADECLVVGDQDARHRVGSRTRTANPPLGSPAGVEAAAVEGDPLAHADQAVAAADRRVRRACAVVGDLELERVGAVADADRRVRVAGVLERVGQRLLDDPVRRQLDPDGQLAPLALDAKLDRKARLPQLPDQLGTSSSPGCGASGSSASPRSMPTRRRISVSAPRPICSIVSSTSRVEAFASPSTPPLGTGLDDDHRDVVGDHVVQLARDPRPLLDDRLPRGHIALALGDPCAPLAVADTRRTSSITTTVTTVNGSAPCRFCLGPALAPTNITTRIMVPNANRRDVSKPPARTAHRRSRPLQRRSAGRPLSQLERSEHWHTVPTSVG